MMNDYCHLLQLWIQERVLGYKSERALRKEQRKQRLIEAYRQLAEDCEPILRPYYDCPVHIVNRFWSGRDIVAMLCYECYPSLEDFINWFCDSDTIEQERMQNWS